MRSAIDRRIVVTAAACVLACSLGAQSPITEPKPASLPDTGLGIVQAVQITIDLNPLLHIQEQQVAISKGVLLSQQGIFDTNVGATVNQARSYTPLTKSSSQTAQLAGIDTGSDNINSTSTNLNGSKLFRTGLSVSPSVQLNRSTDNLTNQTGLNNSSMGVDVRLPLMRNRGRAAVAAGETAAGYQVDASSYDLSQTASQLIANTASSYWNYLGAFQSLDIYRNSEQRGAELLSSLRTLVAADAMPRAELDNAVANLASRTASRVSAEQQVIQARQALVVAMGLGPDQIVGLPAPIDPYPDGTTQPLLPVTPEALRGYIQLALSRRADLLSARKSLESSQTLAIAAKNQIRPQVDATLHLGYSGLQETTRFDKYLASIFQNIYGPNVTGGIEYHFPLENRSARGQLIQSQGSVNQAQLHINDVERNIASNVVTAATGLNSSVLQLQQAQQASRSFLSALEGQRDKLRLGVGSLLDILQTEDRYISAALNEISAKVGYSVAIANFRLATGTYLVPDQPVQSVDRAAFYVPLVP
jgi:outer membrane protein TolC